MQPAYHITTSESVISEHSSLTEFYNYTSMLQSTRFVRFTGKDDEADNIEWRFTYHGRRLILQYNVYNGVLLYPEKNKDIKIVNKLAGKLRASK